MIVTWRNCDNNDNRFSVVVKTGLMFISVFLFLNENVYTSVFSYFCKCLKIL